jgi:hypothetical protein
MAAVKLAIWLARNDKPPALNVQKMSTSSSGPAAAAPWRFNISLLFGRGAHPGNS